LRSSDLSIDTLQIFIPITQERETERERETDRETDRERERGYAVNSYHCMQLRVEIYSTPLDLMVK